MKKICVVVVVYKFPKKKLEFLLHSLQKIGISDKNIFIRDNTNDDIGYAAAINEVVKKQINNYENFLILNPDISFKNDFIQALLDTIEKREADIVGPIFYKGKKKLWASTGVLDRKRYSAGMKTLKLTHLTYVDFVPGAAMLIRKEVFQRIGFFAEDYFLYYDEVDYQYRAKKAGFQLAINPAAAIYHIGSYTVGSASDTMKYYLARNHLLFLERFAPLSIKVREFVRLPRTIYQARHEKAELIGIRDYFLRRFGMNGKLLSKKDKI